MTDAKAAWNDTGEQLTALGSKLGAHYENQRGADRQSAREQTQEAIKKLGDAVKDAFEAVGAAARDEAVKQDVKQVGRSLVGALDVTFRQVSEEVRKAFDRSPTDSPAAGPSTADPSTADPSGPDPSTAGPSTAGPSTAGPSTAGPSTAGPQDPPEPEAHEPEAHEPEPHEPGAPREP